MQDNFPWFFNPREQHLRVAIWGGGGGSALGLRVAVLNTLYEHSFANLTSEIIYILSLLTCTCMHAAHTHTAEFRAPIE